jgi:peptidoglycan/LPS O-acetylase OafA/YrhL
MLDSYIPHFTNLSANHKAPGNGTAVNKETVYKTAGDNATTKPIPRLDMPSRLSGKRENFALIDQLRGVAILLVLLYHIGGIYLSWELPWVNGVRNFTAYGHVKSIVIYLLYLCSAAVPLFFILSGFCIHWSCLHRERFETPRFLWQRFWRLYPVYLITIIFFSVTELRGASSLYTAKQILTHVFLIHNFGNSTILGINGPAWSLAVEVQLYLLYPILLALKQRIGWRGCFLIAASVGLGWRLLAVAMWGLPEHYAANVTMASPLATWLDWMLGAWLADRYALGVRAFPKNNLFPLAAFVGFIISTIYHPLIIFSFFLASLATVLCLDKMLNRVPKPQPRSRLAGWIGKGLGWFGLISYSLYLWHIPIMLHCSNLVKRSAEHILPTAIWGPPTAILSVFLATFTAYFSFRFLEKPGIKLGRKLMLKGLQRPPAGGTRVSDWSQVGGTPGHMNFYARDANSGTWLRWSR